MFVTMIISLVLTGLFLISSAVDPPSNCRFLNPIRDPSAEIALVDFFNNSEPFTFKKTNFFQPQCLLCESLGGKFALVIKVEHRME